MPSERSPSVRPPPSSPVVLIVDQHRDWAELYAEALTSMGFQLVLAADGEQAFALACELHPEVVVTEVALPSVSGLELTRRLRAEAKDVAIIGLTSRGSLFDQQEATLAGCDAFLVKPCTPDALTSAIRDVLTARRLTHAHTRTRIRAEYIEMPGMRLRAGQVQRLCHVDKESCLLVLNALVTERFLMANPDGTYVRATEGSDPAIRHSPFAAAASHD